LRPLRDVLGEVADTLEVGGDLQRRGDEPEVARGRLMQREELDREIVDLDVEPVHHVVACDGRLCEVAIARREGAHGLRDLVLHEPAHLEHARSQLLELQLVRPVGVQPHHPNRPVT